jgi:hypothetical protein
MRDRGEFKEGGGEMDENGCSSANTLEREERKK